MAFEARSAEVRTDFLGSAHVFAAAIRRAFEQEILREIADESLSFSHLKLLFFGSATGEHTVGDAADFLGVSDAAASKTVEKLVRRRLLTRVQRAEDRRSSCFRLTDESRALLRSFEESRHRKAAEVLGRFDPGELQRAAELLDRLAASIVQHGSRPDEVCLQCGISYRERCRFGELSRRECFYRRHKSDKLEPLVSPGARF